MIVKSILIWICIIPLAILNAGLRQKIFTPLLGHGCSLPLSGLTLALLIFIVTLILIPRLGSGTSMTYWKIGLFWVLLTVLFETGLGFLMGNPLSEILNTYDISSGNLWLLVVIFIGFIPRIVAGMKHLIK